MARKTSTDRQPPAPRQGRRARLGTSVLAYGVLVAVVGGVTLVVALL